MATKRFDRRMQLLITNHEYSMLDTLAENEGLSASDMVRQLIRRAHAEWYRAAEQAVAQAYAPKPAAKKKAKAKR